MEEDPKPKKTKAKPVLVDGVLRVGNRKSRAKTATDDSDVFEKLMNIRDSIAEEIATLTKKIEELKQKELDLNKKVETFMNEVIA